MNNDKLLLEQLYEDIYFEQYIKLIEKFDPEMGNNQPFDANKLIEYINRILQRREAGLKKSKNDNKKNTDYIRYPHLHASILDRVTVKTIEGYSINLEEFKNIVKQRPENILRQNDKMKKSRTIYKEYFNTTLPALRGLVVNEDTGEFKIVNTCPSAGECLLNCYAKGNTYTLFPETTISQNKILNYLFNDAEGYAAQLEKEINQKVKWYKRKKKDVQIRWNDSGDLLSPKYFNIVMNIINNTPEAEHYLYTKEVAMIKSYPNPPENIIFNFSFGARKNQEALIDLNKDKYSRIVDTRKQNKVNQPLLNAIVHYKYIEKKGKNWVYNNVEATKEAVAQTYDLDSKKILTVDEINNTPKGRDGEYHVIVLPGESDVSAARKDVRGTFLMIH
jgi:hypothetical protein